MAYYPFSGNANDASGNGNNPIFNNATLTTDRFGNPNSAYSFNGTDNYIRIPNSTTLNSTNQISICAWVKVAGFYQGKCHGNNVVMKGNTDYQTGNYKIRFDDSYFTNSQNCSISNPDVTHETFFGLNSTPSSNAPFIQTNQWYSVVYTCDGTTARIYVNCQLVGSGPANGITFTNGDDLFLGTLNNPLYPYWFNGVMDEVRIYNRAINDNEIEAYGDCSIATNSCSNWLSTPVHYSYVDIGKLDVTGDHITVEAVINRTTPFVPGGNDNTEGDIVSKHDNPTDVNYLLRPNHAFITTTNGFFQTPDIADIQLNRTYHVAMVYDGDTLKFYRDGCLMSKIAASGDLYQNNWDTRIGYYQNQIWNTNFIGYINEVRIWNVARTQAQIQAYMNTSLPNPTAQAGLLAYYTFDNLLNKQGNPNWNGVLGGSASINQTNPSCNPIVNSCKVISCNLSVSKSPDTTVCKGSFVNMFAKGGTTYTWTPQTGLDNPNSANPIATPSVSTKYYVTVDDGTGCSKKDSVQINVNNLPVISKSNDTSICMNSTTQLFATGGTSFSWSPVSSLDNNSISNPKASPSATTKYYVTATNATGCSKTDSIKITVNSLPVISKSNDTSICENTTVPLFASGGSSYSWIPASTLDNPASASPLASPTASTSYYVTVTDANGCSKSDSIEVAVNSLPVISKSNDTTICNNSSAQLSAGGGSSYSWTPVASLNNPAIANPVASPGSSTRYFITVSNGGCSALDSVNVAVYPTATISISNDTTVCANSSTQLLANGGNTYVWSPSAFLDNGAIPNPVASPGSTTVFHVSITDSYSCAYSDSVKISVRQPAVFAVSPGNSVCSNTSQQLNASGGDIYAWTPVSFLDNPAISNPIASPDSSITYAVVIKDTTCKQTDTLFTKVTILRAPVLSATRSNDIDCSSGASQLNASGALSYTWSPVTGLDNFRIANPVASPTSTTVYTVTGKDQNGCSNSDTVTVKVNFNGNSVYGLPNSFTPNNDGLNDCFGIKYWGQVSELDFNIYNRFGERVFHTNNPDNCWDGTFRGELQQADVFIYTIKAKTACGNIDKKGIVTLLR